MSAERLMPSTPKRSPHEEKLDEMHDALYRLGSQSRTESDYGGNGAKLLPEGLAPKEKPGARAARKHIDRLHKAFKSLKKGKE